MKVDIPKYDYTEEQLDELVEIIHEFQYEFDTPENREKLNKIIMSKSGDFISKNRDSKINQIIPDGTSEIQ
jgi:hypothetical protein